MVDPRLGKVVLAFPDPAAFGWAVVVLGVSLGIPGLMVLCLSVFATPPNHRWGSNEWAALGLGVFCTLAGGIALFLAVRDMRRKPMWHLCAQGIFRAPGSPRLSFWRDIPELRMVEQVRGQFIVGYYLRGGPHRVFVPNRSIAERAVDLWRAQNPSTAAQAQ